MTPRLPRSRPRRRINAIRSASRLRHLINSHERTIMHNTRTKQIAGRLVALAASTLLAACASVGGDQKPPTFELLSTPVKAQGASLRLITPSWDFHWECNAVHFCESWFSGASKLVRPDGSVVTWNLVESYTLDDCNAGPEHTRWYKHANNTDTNSFGWGKKESKSNHASAFLRFTGPEGVWTARVRSQSCP